MTTHLEDYSHKRFNILTGEWVLVSPHRAKRPWQGQEEVISNEKRPSYNKSCYLCAGNTRISGDINPKYTEPYVFTNDFGALQKDSPSFSVNEGLLKAESEKGICKVVCFSPDHSKSLAEMSTENIRKVIVTWIQEYNELGNTEGINYVQIFENKGAVMGCSNPHPHGQIWTQSSLPNEVVKKDINQRNYFSENKKSLLGSYITQELEAKERIIFENNSFVVLVPFWAVWPFETMIAPKIHQTSINVMTEEQQLDYAEAISVLTKAYDKLFNCSFPYSSGIHQAPTNEENNEYWHWHMSFYPPLLRSATIKKFMVGYEMFGSPQRDITAETAATRIKNSIV
jgi:UDPglucose--hexose-1-phosphate uridylyltransferase